MATPRVGAVGVGTTKGDLYVVDEDEDLERIPVGMDDQVLVADSTTFLGVAWKDISATTKATVRADATDAIFKQVDLGGGAIANPLTQARGTHAVLSYITAVLRGIPWQLAMPQIYSDTTALDVNLYWASDGTDTGDVEWGVAFERDAAVGAFDIDADGFAGLTTATDAAPGVAGELVQTVINVSGAALDGILNGEPFRLFTQRDGASGLDDLADSALLVRVVIEEV